jgi:hypothetical protein
LTPAAAPSAEGGEAATGEATAAAASKRPSSILAEYLGKNFGIESAWASMAAATTAKHIRHVDQVFTTVVASPFSVASRQSPFHHERRGQDVVTY